MIVDFFDDVFTISTHTAIQNDASSSSGYSYSLVRAFASSTTFISSRSYGFTRANDMVD